MTANQLMTLLAIYRGSPIDKVSCGTTEVDLRFLEVGGYIVQFGEDWQTTLAGTVAVRAALAFVGAQAPLQR